MNVLFEDEHVIVCVKPAGVNSEESAKLSMPALIEEHTGKKPFTVHRLDRETAGVMVYALNKNAAAKLSFEIQQGGMHKKYYAVLRGRIEPESGIMVDCLLRDKQKNKTFVVPEDKQGAKKAELEYKIASENQGFSLADIKLITGRTHQIRVQFSSRNAPLYGDSKYGRGPGELALFAYSLSFTHPVTGRKMVFSYEPDTSVTPWSLFENYIHNNK